MSTGVERSETWPERPAERSEAGARNMGLTSIRRGSRRPASLASARFGEWGETDGMQRLTGMDATFLYMETPSSYMHVAGLMILDPSTIEGGFSYADVREFYASRLHLAAPFRRRLAEIPLG